MPQIKSLKYIQIIYRFRNAEYQKSSLCTVLSVAQKNKTSDTKTDKESEYIKLPAGTSQIRNNAINEPFAYFWSILNLLDEERFHLHTLVLFLPGFLWDSDVSPDKFFQFQDQLPQTLHTLIRSPRYFQIN